MNEFKGQSVILLSGGPHSAYAALCAARSEPGPLLGVFMAHKQPDGAAQESSVIYVATRLGIETMTLHAEFPDPVNPEGRNELLVRGAFARGADSVWMGLRHTFPFFDRNGDSNLMWLRRLMGEFPGKDVRAPAAYVPSGTIRRTLAVHGIFTARLHVTR